MLIHKIPTRLLLVFPFLIGLAACGSNPQTQDRQMAYSQACNEMQSELGEIAYQLDEARSKRGLVKTLLVGQEPAKKKRAKRLQLKQNVLRKEFQNQCAQMASLEN